MNSACRAVVLTATLVFVSAWASLANASSTYPGYVAKQYGVAPQCTFCHVTPLGGLGTTKGIPFAETLEAAGLTFGMKESDFMAIFNANSGGDSDHDGFDDLEEILAEGNPSDASVGPGGGAVEPYEYGCVGKKKEVATAPAASSSIAGAGATRSPALWLMIIAGLVVVRRRMFR